MANPATHKEFKHELAIRILVTFAFLNLSLALAGDGGTSSGGGNNVAAQFPEIGKRIGDAYAILCKGTDFADPICKSLVGYQKGLANVKTVVPNENLVGSDGKPREAGGNGVDKIEVNPGPMSKLIHNQAHPEAAVRVIAHEYFIPGGIEKWDQYPATPGLITFLKKHHIDMNALVGTPKNAPESQPCGKTGTTSERIADCHTVKSAWTLVMRTDDLFEIWQSPIGQYWTKTIGGTSMESGVDPCEKIAQNRIGNAFSVKGAWTLPLPSDFFDQPDFVSFFMEGIYWTREISSPKAPDGLPSYRAMAIIPLPDGGRKLSGPGSVGARPSQLTACILNAAVKEADDGYVHPVEINNP